MRRQRPPRVAAALGNILRPARCHHLAAARATFWPHVYQPIGFGNQIQIMLDHDHAMPRIGQALQHGDDALHIGHVQAYRGFVQHIQSVRRFLPAPASSVTSLRRCASPPLSVGEAWPSSK